MILSWSLGTRIIDGLNFNFNLFDSNRVNKILFKTNWFHNKLHVFWLNKSCVSYVINHNIIVQWTVVSLYMGTKHKYIMLGIQEISDYATVNMWILYCLSVVDNLKIIKHLKYFISNSLSSNMD